MSGEVTPYRNDTDREMPFRQESNFYYLTGCTVPQSSLLVTTSSTSADPSLALSIPPIEPVDLMWSVPPPTLQAAQESHDVTTVLHNANFAKVFTDALATSPGALVHVLPLRSTQFPKLPDDLLQLVQSSAQVTDGYLFEALGRARSK